MNRRENGHHDSASTSSITTPASAPRTNGQNGHAEAEPTVQDETNTRRRDESNSRRNGRVDHIARSTSKKRKLDTTNDIDNLTRAVSPPWQFGSVKQSRVSIDGKRRSARTTGTSSPAVESEPEQKRTRRESASNKNRPSYTALHNGASTASRVDDPVSTHKRVPSSGKSASWPSFKKPAKPAQRDEPTSPTTPKAPKYARSSLHEAGTLTEAAAVNPVNNAGARRTSRRSDSKRHVQEVPAPKNIKPDPSPARFQKLRLRIREPKIARSHPTHWPPVRKYSSFDEWLRNDDALEGEAEVPVTEVQAQKEARSRVRLVRATQPGGPLTAEKCARFLEVESWEPPSQYHTWNFTIAHAGNFHGLLAKEKEKHKKWARQLAVACQTALATNDRFIKVREQKSQEEIEQEELGYQIKRYRQLVKDVGASWGLARNEVNRIRFERWEKEQELAGKKTLDDMLNRSTWLLKQTQTRESSEFPDDERSSLGPAGSETGSVHGDSDREGSQTSGRQESSAGSENFSDADDVDDEEPLDGAQDDDANLTTEALREKYADALEQPWELDQAVSSDDEVADDESDASRTESEDTAVSYKSMSEAESEEETTPGSNLTSLLLPVKTRQAMDNSTEYSARPVEVDSKMETPDNAEAADSTYGDEVLVPELEEVDDLLLDHSDEDSIDSDEDDSDESESGVDDSDETDTQDDGVGLIGFFGKAKESPQSISTSKSSGDTQNSHVESEEDGVMSQSSDAGLKVNTALTKNYDSQSSTPRTPRTPHTPAEPHKTEVPSLLLRGSLREYQHDGLDWLAKLYTGNRNGILADEMGLGKTIQTISLLAHLAVDHQIWGPHLVVVPTSVMLNWEMEFKKWLPGFKILTYYGDIEERKRKRQGWLNDDKWNVCIASYQLILKDAQAFKKRSWHYLILDEAHYIKNFQSQKWQTMLTFKTHSRLLLTGTPLQNDLQELWSLLYFLMPAGLDGSGGFADLERFLNSMKRPADQILNQGQQKLDAEAQARVSKLHEVLRPFLLRRLKSEVEKQMPGKYEHVVYCRLSKRQRQLYDEFMSRGDTKRSLSSGNYMSIMNCLMSLRKVCNHPDLFETRQIVTSYAMPKSAVADFEIKELVVRRRLFKQQDDAVNFEYFGLIPTAFEKHSRLHQFRRYHLRAIEPLHALVQKQTGRIAARKSDASYSTISGNLGHLRNDADRSVLDMLKNCVKHARRTTEQWPIYGTDFCNLVTVPNRYFPAPPSPHELRRRKKLLDDELSTGQWAVQGFVKRLQVLMPSIDEVAERCQPLVRKFTCITPAVVAEDIKEYTLTPRGMHLVREAQALTQQSDPYHESRIRSSIAFPDKRLLQYDCGKLQALDKLLRELQSGGHRCLIFTQMTKVLDILEQFLNIHGHRYLRLDGSTKIEQRQILTDRFNKDTRILAFILSSRSGGLGINLTGADTVIFYDLDWNPAMDAQCQDRCHRIGQTRDVHIYRFVSEHTIEANILRKSNQKRLLDDVIIQKGDFTTDSYNRVTFKDALAEPEHLDADAAEASKAVDRVLGEVAGLVTVLDSIEDKEDAAAAKEAQKEAVFNPDEHDFDETATLRAESVSHAPGTDDAAAGVPAPWAKDLAAPDDAGSVDDWMVRYLDEYEMKGTSVLLPKSILNARKNAARKGRDYRRKR